MLTQDLDRQSAEEDEEQVCPNKHLYLADCFIQSPLQVKRTQTANPAIVGYIKCFNMFV